MEIAILLARDTEVVSALRLSKNIIYIRYIEREQINRHKKHTPARIIFTNNELGEKIGLDDSGWNLQFEGKKHFVVFSILADEFICAAGVLNILKK